MGFIGKTAHKILCVFLIFAAALLSISLICGYCGASLYLPSLFGTHTALFGGIICMGIIASLYCVFLPLTKHKVILIPLCACLVILLSGILITKSRTSIFASFVGCLIVIYAKYEKLRTRGYILIFLVLILCGGYALYRINEDSVKGRLLIWEVSLKSPQIQTWYGNGINSFSRNYLYMQADWFETHPDCPGLAYADNVNRPFNDYIRVLFEQGAIGILLLLGVMTLTVVSAKLNKDALEISLIISFWILSLSSYPIESPFIIFIASVAVGIIISKEWVISKNSIVRWTMALFALIGLVMIPLINREWKKISDIDKHAQLAFLHEPPSKAVSILEEASNQTPSAQLLCDWGDCLLALGDTDEALSNYKKAGWMVPRRLTPRYKLFLYYRDNGMDAEALEIAKQIIHYEPYYIKGTAVIRMLTTVHSFLDESNRLYTIKP